MKLPEATRSRLLHQNLVIEGLLLGLTEEQLNLEFYTGKWTIHQQLAHLASYNQTFITRVNIIMESFNAKFHFYVADNDPEFLLAVEMPHNYLMNYLREGRQTIQDMLFSFNSGELIRIGIHPKYGNLSIVMWTEFFLLHEAHHIYCIFKTVNEIKNQAQKAINN